jgi:phosphoadenosine phosphosulfate reductase
MADNPFEYIAELDYQYFNQYKYRFIKANEDRFNFITEEVVTYIQQYRDKYYIEDMVFFCSVVERIR